MEQLRERLEAGEPPEKKLSRMTEEEQRLVQQALQRNLFSVARQIPMKIKINGRGEEAPMLNEGGFVCWSEHPKERKSFFKPWVCGLHLSAGL